MLLTLTTTHSPATDLGFPLRQNPALSQSFNLSSGSFAKNRCAGCMKACLACSILYQAGLLEPRKNERWVDYRLPGKQAPSLVRGALHWVRTSLANNAQILENANRLKAILKQDPKQLAGIIPTW